MTVWIWIWLAIIVLSVVIEAVTMELVSCWCIVGGICALILALCHVPVEIQWIVFGVVSVALLLGLRKVTHKLLIKDNEKTNVEAEFGKTAVLITPITKSELGTIKIKGIVWTVTTADHSEIDAGETVQLVNIDGNKYIVKKLKDKDKDKEKN